MLYVCSTIIVKQTSAPGDQVMNNLTLRSLLTLLFASSSVIHATDATWTNDEGGFFSDGGNWDPGVPSTTGTATFDLDDIYTVNFSADAQTGQLILTDGDVTLNIGASQTYQSGAIMVAEGSDDTAALRIISGTLNASGSGVNIGDSGTGILVVQGGANMTTGDFMAGNFPSGDANITITGASTQLSTARFNIRRGTANITISDGATLQTNGDMDIIQQRGQATVTVDNATLTVGGGSMLTVGREHLGESDAELFVINGSTVTTRHFSIARQHDGNDGATGLVEISGEDSSVSVQRRVTIGSRSDPGSSGEVSNVATLRILNGGEFLSSTTTSAQRETYIGSGSTGEGGRGIGIVEIDGEDSIWRVGNATQTTDAIFGHDGGRGFLTVSNGGTIQMVAGDAGSYIFLEDSELSIASGYVDGNSLSFSSNARFTLTLSDSDTAPLITLTDEFDPGSASFELVLAPGFSQFNEPFVVASYDSWSEAEFGSLILPPGATVEYGATEFVVTVVPEPGTFALLAGMSALAIVLLRRRSRR